MNAMPQPRPDHSEPAVPSAHGVDIISSASQGSLFDAIGTGPGLPPPHLLWATLETAYAAPEDSAFAEEERLAPYIALPLAIGLSLILWVIIVELVLMR